VISSRRGFIPARPVVRVQGMLLRLAVQPPVWVASREVVEFGSPCSAWRS